MKRFAIISCLIGVALGNPFKLDDLQKKEVGYFIDPSHGPTGVYETPIKPSGLYETPEVVPTTTPPAPPLEGYLPPDTGESNPHVTEVELPLIPSIIKLMPYEFTYGVDDEDSGNQYKHSVSSDGEHVVGEYRVKLPDGRLQVVKFTADSVTGYLAEVSYLK